MTEKNNSELNQISLTIDNFQTSILSINGLFFKIIWVYHISPNVSTVLVENFQDKKLPF